MEAKSITRKMLPPEVGAIVEFLDGEEKGRQIPLVFTRTILGRKYGDILIRDLQASGTHAAIEIRKDGIYLIDLQSSNGTFYLGKKVKQTRVEPEDEMQIGFTRFKIILNPELSLKLAQKRPTSLVLKEGGLTEILKKEFLADVLQIGETIRVRMNVALRIIAGPMKGQKLIHRAEGTLSLGRMNSDFMIKDPDVSRKHAIIEVEPSGQVLLRDLSSRNGTFVNQKKVMNAVLKDRDQIRIGTTVIEFMLEQDR